MQLPFSEVPPCSLMTKYWYDTLKMEDEFSMDCMNEPNIIINTSCSKFDENEWKWMKIGSDVIIRNISVYNEDER